MSKFKAGDRVHSVLDGMKTGAMGTVIKVDNEGILVQPDNRPLGQGFIYNHDGHHEVDTNFSIELDEEKVQ